MTATLQRPTTTAPRAKPPVVRMIRGGGAANIALGALTLAAVGGLARLFNSPLRLFAPVALVAITVHVVAWGCRRKGLGVAPAAALTVLAASVCAAWAILGRTTAYGIPWLGTFDAARTALSNAATVYRTSAAPVPVIPGFALAASFGAATTAFLSDWAAFRMQATTEACLPSFSLFVLSAALAQGRSVVLAGALWLGALLAFLLSRQVAVDSPANAWFANGRERGTRTVVLSGTLIALAAVAIAVVVGPELPGASVHPVFDWRQRSTGGGTRQIGFSPLVDIKDRLKTLSHQEVFTVSSSRPTYWRLTSLDTFDGEGWKLNSEYTATKGRLPGAASSASNALPDVGPTTTLHSAFRITTLSSTWLPAPYRPTRVTGAPQVSFSADSGSLITDRTTSDGLSYAIDSSVPAATPQLLNAPEPALARSAALSRYLALPASVPDIVRVIAEQVTAQASTPYLKAKALQDWLRSPPFRYDLNVAPDDSPNALVNFLTVTRAGFCQQFAASYAVLARAIGLPARVAVGFTEGDLGQDGLYHVTDAQAHAWPEVYFADVGWIAFEPTPGRGSPDAAAQSVTGVPPAQQSNAGAQTGPGATTPSPTIAVPTTVAPSSPAGGASRTTTTTIPPARDPDRDATPDWLIGIPIVLGLPLLWAAAMWLATSTLRGRRRRGATTPDDKVSLAWTEARECLAQAGAPPFAWETPAEYAKRAGRVAALPDEAIVALGDVAHAVEVTDYAPDGADDPTARRAEGAARRIESAVDADLEWWEKAIRVVDPRPVVRLLVSRRA